MEIHVPAVLFQEPVQAPVLKGPRTKHKYTAPPLILSWEDVDKRWGSKDWDGSKLKKKRWQWCNPKIVYRKSQSLAERGHRDMWHLKARETLEEGQFLPFSVESDNLKFKSFLVRGPWETPGTSH